MCICIFFWEAGGDRPLPRGDRRSPRRGYHPHGDPPPLHAPPVARGQGGVRTRHSPGRICDLRQTHVPRVRWEGGCGSGVNVWWWGGERGLGGLGGARVSFLNGVFLCSEILNTAVLFFATADFFRVEVMHHHAQGRRKQTIEDIRRCLRVCYFLEVAAIKQTVLLLLSSLLCLFWGGGMGG